VKGVVPPAWHAGYLHARSARKFPCSGGGNTVATIEAPTTTPQGGAIMASEIEQLPNLTGFLKIASQPQWRRVQLAPPDEGK